MDDVGNLPHPVFVVMGPAGSGKTTIGKRLAQRLGGHFLDADDFHSPASIAKMRAGVPLTDQDRLPWLELLAAQLEAREGPTVLACSALKRSYRAALGLERPEYHLVYLKVPRVQLDARLRARAGHFAGPGLLESQLATLEEPDHASHYDGTRDPEALVEEIVKRARISLDCPRRADR